MRVSNGTEPGDGGFAGLLQLQAEFQARLSEETLRYVRRLQGVLEGSVASGVTGQASGRQVPLVTSRARAR